MKSFMLMSALASGSLAGLACRSSSSSSSSSVDTHCPTVTETATLCSTCAVKECLAISTISNPCDCSDPVPTSTTSYPCSQTGNCPLGCASTIYVSATSSSSCPRDTQTPDPTVSPTISDPEPCPTVTSTINVCPTCPMRECIAYETIKRPCTCPTYIPTHWTAYPCAEPTYEPPKPVTTTTTAKGSQNCPTGCVTTSYIYEEDDCPSSVDTRVTCTPTVTISEYPSSGCPYSCSTGWNACILDKILTLPCGCDTAKVVTSTSTVPCATSSPCYMCNTAWPWTVSETDCPTPTPTVTLW